MKPVSSALPAGCRKSKRRRIAAFSIVEAIGYLVVFTLIMGGLTYAMSSLFTQQAQPQVVYNGHTYAQAPSFDDFREAIDLHAAFAGAADLADNVMVLGGTRSHPAFDPAGPSSALAANFTDAVLAAGAAGDAFTAFSSWDQRQLNSTQLGPYLTSHQDAADFTILTVQGLSRITSITQQRRYQATINGRDLSLYEVTFQAIDWSSGAPVLATNAATGTTPTYVYRFYYGAGEDVWSMPPGATHYWYRADPTWDRDQEGPARVVFADPYSLAGQDPSAPLSPVSRFIYFLPQLR